VVHALGRFCLESTNYPDLPGTRRALRSVAVFFAFFPFAYIDDRGVVGHCIKMHHRVCIRAFPRVCDAKIA